MANPIGQQDDVVSATDKLMKNLLDQAGEDLTNVDFALQVVQAATRWTAVKNRMNVPDEGNAFDDWRSRIAGGPGAQPPTAERSETGDRQRKTRRGAAPSSGGNSGQITGGLSALADAFSTYRAG